MVNKVTLIGRAGKDPETKHFDNGGAISNFTMVTNKSWKDKVCDRDWETIQLRPT